VEAPRRQRLPPQALFREFGSPIDVVNVLWALPLIFLLLMIGVTAAQALRKL